MASDSSLPIIDCYYQTNFNTGKSVFRPKGKALLFVDEFGQINTADAVTPFVIVPSDNFDEVVANLHR